MKNETTTTEQVAPSRRLSEREIAALAERVYRLLREELRLEAARGASSAASQP